MADDPTTDVVPDDSVGICRECGGLTPHECPPPPIDDWRSGMFSGTWSDHEPHQTPVSGGDEA